jgi:stage II sporulation protein AA (anti-sigma F factor antagonist)
MNMTALVDNSVLVVQLRGELDHHAVEGLRDEIEEQLRQTDYRGLVMNFRNIEFMDSSALGLILGRYRSVSQHSGKMALCEVTSSLRKIFELSGILKILPLFESEAEAIKFVKES